MKFFKSLLVLVFGFNSITYAQNNTINFKSGDFLPKNNIEEVISNNTVDPTEVVDGVYYRIIQFNKIPNTKTKIELKEKGINLISYIPNNTFYAAIKENVDVKFITSYEVVLVEKIQPKFKLSKRLSNNDFPDWALFGEKIALNAIYFNSIAKEEAIKSLANLNVEIMMTNDAQVVRFKIDKKLLSSLYQLPHFYYFEEIDEPGKPENLVGVTNHRSNNLAMSYFTGLHYDGTGVTVMLQDNSALDEHIDYTGRFTNHSSAAQNGDHGEHCGGTIAGAGNIDPTARGMAYGADVIVYGSSNNNYNDVPSLYTNDGVRVTSKSYSDGVNAGYTSLARQLDQQIRQMPDLVHVFSAGNSNGSGSTAAGTQWFNVTGGHKAGKNVITVANLTDQDVIASSSSRGPCEDGRIKPDISAVGTNVYSTIDPNTYGNKTGTSMSCPGVAGTVTQLYHAYKDLNGGTNPPSGLIKAAVLNTGDEVGNIGPDFIYGWGRINARRAYNIINNNYYLEDNVSQSGNNTHNITVPAGTDQVRIMVYWTDYEGVASASPALVNDLNMVVTDPNSTTYNPWVLDPTPNATTLNLPATRGVDNLNNMEQVTIDNPVAGSYSIDVTGFSVPQGPQTYYVVYEFVTDDVVLTYPIGGEGLNSISGEKIRWDAYGNSGTFTLEYSDNNGASWNLIASGIAATERFYTWNVPSIVTGEALVRITRGASSSQSHQPFSIIGVPTGLTVNWACPDSMEVAWNAVTGATAYEVSMLGNKYMDSVGTAIGTTSLIIAANANQEHWWSVKALAPNNCVGRRAIAQYQSAGTFNCVMPVDASLSTVYPGNEIVSECELDSVNVEVTLENPGINPISNINVYYSLNGGAPVAGVYTGTLNSGQNDVYTFSPPLVITSGTYTLDVWVDYTGDGNNFNDTLSSSFTYNTSVLTIPFTQDFESESLCNTSSNCEVTVCPLTNEWINEANGTVDDIDWRVNEGPTPSRVGITPNETGPTQDYNPGTSTGNYIYTEASAGCDYKFAHLITPCIDLTTATNPELSFAYHMYDAQGGPMMGQLNVDIKINGSWTNQIMPQIQSNQGDQWNIQTIDLTPFIGNTVNLRFRGRTSAGWRGDMALDDISVSEAVGIDEFDLTNKFIVYPNPSNGLFNFNYKGNENAFVKIMDVNGRIIIDTQLKPMQIGTFNLSDYANGLYMVVINSDSKVSTLKIIKE